MQIEVGLCFNALVLCLAADEEMLALLLLMRGLRVFIVAVIPT